MTSTTKTHRSHILIEFSHTLGFLLLRCGFLWIQKLKWRLDGTLRKLRDSRDPGNYDNCAQLLRVWRKHAFDPYELQNSPSNFVLCHQDFVNPSYVLKDEISFYCLTEHDAYFVEAPPGVEVWRNAVDPFHKHGQHEYAVKVIRMPLHAFYRLADELGPIRENLIFVDFIPRSGSTLMCRVFEETGECVSYSEPHALNDMFGAYTVNSNPEETKRAIAAQIRFLCKPRSQPTSAFMFKMLPSTLQSKVLNTYLHELYPDAKYLFLYRNGAAMARSLTRLMLQVNAIRLVNFLKFMPSIWKKIRVWFASINQDLDPTAMDILQQTEHIEYITCGLFWVLCIRDQMHKKDVPCIKYEDIISCPEASIRAILDYCDLPADKLTPRAMQALKGDSQHNLAMSWEELVKRKWSDGDTSSSSKEAKQEMDALCRHFGVPLLSEDCVMPNTLTVSFQDNNNYL